MPDGAHALLFEKKPFSRSFGQRAILARLLSIGESDAETLLSDINATPAQLRTLVAKGLVSVRAQGEGDKGQMSREEFKEFIQNIVSQEIEANKMRN